MGKNNPLGRSTPMWLLVLSLACGAPTAKNEAAKPPVVASASVDRAVATTGDLITYTLTVDRADDVSVEIPEAGGEIAGFRILDSGQRSSVAAGRTIERRWYQLRADLVGSYVLPAVTVTWRRGQGTAERVQTSEIFVEVKSVLPAEGEAADIRDVKPLEKPPVSRVWLWLAAGVALALAALAFYLLRRRKAGARLVPKRPAHELAFEALGRLRQTDFEDPAALRRYYFEISEVVRTYVESRFAINATDLTTEEILRRVTELAEIDPVNHERLRRFLLDTDQVKFAAHQPAEDEIAATYERALSFVEGTRPRVDPATEPVSAAKAA